MNFEANYFEEENRLGFTIPAFMKHAWAAQLKVLDRIDEICSNNNIPYYANRGTLLGTVRHHGYIPWDDDLDICMLRADLNRFAEVIESYNDIMMISIFNTPSHGPNANRVVTRTAFTMDRDALKDSCGFPFSAGVDIFVLDYVPRDKALEDEMVEALEDYALYFEAQSREKSTQTATVSEADVLSELGITESEIDEADDE